jgi:transcriptional regulator with XRE-family HTH domain
LSLQDLARITGFTRGYLSKLENSTKSPPVATLITLAKALRVSLAKLLAEEETGTSITLVKAKERRLIARDGSEAGYSYEPLADGFRDRRMEPFILTLPLKPKRKPVFTHQGQEMLLVVEGVMRFFYGDKEYLVETGDCVYFDSQVPHYGVCEGDREVKCVMVIWGDQTQNRSSGEARGEG